MISLPIHPMKPEFSFNHHGLTALLVDHNPTSLFLLTKMFQSCHYQVTPCSRPAEALTLIRNGEIKFDIVITEVNFSPDISGIQFLEIIISETDLPVVIISADDRIDMISECILKGACAYLPKPVRMEVIQLLWQHVARKEIFGFRSFKKIDNVENVEPRSSNSGEEDKDFCGSSDGVPVDEQEKVQHKKQRLVWTDGLHQKFVDAVEQLGIHNAVPKKVLELMNVPGLKRENVASHLQKYRLNLRKQTANVQESFTVKNSSSVIRHDGLCLRTPPPRTLPFYDTDHSL